VLSASLFILDEEGAKTEKVVLFSPYISGDAKQTFAVRLKSSAFFIVFSIAIPIRTTANMILRDENVTAK